MYSTSEGFRFRLAMTDADETRQMTAAKGMSAFRIAMPEPTYDDDVTLHMCVQGQNGDSRLEDTKMMDVGIIQGQADFFIRFTILMRRHN